MRIVLYGILLVLAAAIGYVTLSWYVETSSDKAYGGPFALTDQHGNTITEQALRGHPSTLFFGFTNCPEVCPTTLFELDGWLKTLGDEGKDIHSYFISVDPERDTVDVLNRYVSNVSDRIIGITGDPDKVADVIKEFRIYAKKVPIEDGGYTMDHTASVLLLDSNGAFFGTIAYGENPDTALAKLRRLAKS